MTQAHTKNPSEKSAARGEKCRGHFARLIAVFATKGSKDPMSGQFRYGTIAHHTDAVQVVADVFRSAHTSAGNLLRQSPGLAHSGDEGQAFCSRIFGVRIVKRVGLYIGNVFPMYKPTLLCGLF